MPSARDLVRRLALAFGRRLRPGRLHEVRFSDRAAGSFPEGTTLLEAAAALGVDLDHFCGGNCSCGTCRVEIASGRCSPLRGKERLVLGEANARAGHRLACQARVAGPVEVRVPRWF